MTIRIPAEWEPQACCWMAWAVHREWGKATNKVKRELSRVVQTIARYEPVRLLAWQGSAAREARREFSACGNVTVIEAPVDDIWTRDIVPTFALRRTGTRQEVIAIDWNFNAWGGAFETRPPRPGDRLAKTAASIFGVPRVRAPFVAEGGAFAADGCGTLIMTRSCLLNPSRNPLRRGVDPQRRIEGALRRLGVCKAIWLEGDPCEPGTSGHVDGYVLLAPSRVVLVDACDDEDVRPPMWRRGCKCPRG
jgi:agmatine deiminase